MGKELRLAQQHVTEAHQPIERQRELIAVLEARGQDTGLAQDLLRNLEETTRQMEVHRDLLAREGA